MALPAAQLDIRIVEARLVRIFDSLKPNQDVFVQLVCGYEDGSEKVVGKTEVCKNGNLAPRWNQRFLCGRDSSKGGRTLKFKVHIDHVWRNPVLCGEAEFGLDNLWRRAGSGRPQEVPVPLFKKGEQTGLLNISIALQGPATGPPAGGGYSTPVNQMNLDPYSPHSGPGAPWERPMDPSELPRGADFAASVGVGEVFSEQPGQVPRPADRIDPTAARMQELRRREEQLRQQQWEERQRAVQEQQYRLQEQKLQEQREQEQRLQEQRLQEQRLQEQRMREQMQRDRVDQRVAHGSYQMRDLHSGAPLSHLQYPQDPPPAQQLAPPNGDPTFATQRLGPETPSSFATPQRLAPAAPAEVKGVSCGWCKERSPKANLPLPSSPTDAAAGGRSPINEEGDPNRAGGASGQQWWHSFIERG